MLHALLQVVWTEMCFGSVCTQPPYNVRNPPSVFFLIYSNLYPVLKPCRLSVWHLTVGGPAHGCWLTEAFQHRLRWWSEILLCGGNTEDKRAFDLQIITWNETISNQKAIWQDGSITNAVMAKHKIILDTIHYGHHGEMIFFPQIEFIVIYIFPLT